MRRTAGDTDENSSSPGLQEGSGHQPCWLAKSLHFSSTTLISCTLKKRKNSTRHVFHCEAESLLLEPALFFLNMVHYFPGLGLDLLRRVWVPYMLTLRTQGHQEISELICRWAATPDLVMSCLKRRAQGTRYPRSYTKLLASWSWQRCCVCHISRRRFLEGRTKRLRLRLYPGDSTQGLLSPGQWESWQGGCPPLHCGKRLLGQLWQTNDAVFPHGPLPSPLCRLFGGGGVTVVVFLPLLFGSEDCSRESPGFDQGNLWSLGMCRPHVEEGWGALRFCSQMES